MFCTLKQNGRSDQAYIFEATRPPFSKKREGRLAKIACTKCRISKLKCSGEPGGCQRCLAKKIDCRYPNPPRGNCHKKTRSTVQAPTPPETPQVQSPSRTPSVPLDITADDNFGTVSSGHEMIYPGTLDDLDLDLSGFQVPDFGSMGGFPGLVAESDYMDLPDAMTPWQQSMPYISDTTNSPWNGSPECEEVFFSTETTTSPVPSLAESHKSDTPTCSCFSRAISTYEAIEVAFWSQSEQRTNPHDILQHQKKALIECEALLGCRRCRTQSAFTMLLLSMCRRVLTILEALCRGAGRDNPDASKRRRQDDDENSGGTFGISIRNRPLDDDDERLVLQSLVAARVARLGRLLDELEKVVVETDWVVHRGVVRDLQARVRGGLFEVGGLRAG